MNGIEIDPRIVAEALQLDTLDLARVLTKWANEALPHPDFDMKFEPSSLENFDDAVAVSRRYLEAAHEAMAAWNQDNPPDFDEAA
jgi:hypothetical protein